MSALLFLALMLTNPSATGANRPASQDDSTVAAAFDITLHGVLGSEIQVRFRAAAGEGFSQRLRSPGGELVEVRGVLLRGDKLGAYELELQFTEKSNRGGTSHLSFSGTLVPGKDAGIYQGWARWYEVKLMPAKSR